VNVHFLLVLIFLKFNNFFLNRWGFNQESEKCEEFNYGGCKGNLNSFLTSEECTNSCENKGTTARDMCLLPRSEGPCKDKLPKW
jgi:hypothetical protein